MDYTPTRFALLHKVAAGDPDAGNTNSDLMTGLVNGRYVDGLGFHYRLTETGADLYRQWRQIEQVTALTGVTVRQGRILRRCICADRHTGYIVDIEYPNPPDGGITGRTSCELSGAGAKDYAQKLREENPGAHVAITATLNLRYREDCSGDIRPGDRYAERHGAAKPGETGNILCLRCAIAVLLGQVVVS